MRQSRSVEIEKIHPFLPPDAVIFSNVPVESFGKSTTNIYDEFYAWLKKLPLDPAKFSYSQLHNQVYTGELLDQWLRKTNKKVLKARNPALTGKRLERVASFSSVGSGPLGSVEDYTLLGDSGFVVPSTGHSAEAAAADNAWQLVVLEHLKRAA